MQVHDHEGARRLQLEERALSLDTRVFTLLSPGPDDPMLSLDMSMQQLKVLLLVDGLGIPSMGDLAHLLHIGQSAISGLVDRLVDHGWVRREEDHLDRRIVRVQSTDGGHALVQRIRMAGRGRLQRVLARLTGEELQHVVGALEMLHRAASEEVATHARSLGASVGSRSAS